MFASARAFMRPVPASMRSRTAASLAVNDVVPDQIMVDIIETDSKGEAPCTMNESQDFGAVLKSKGKCIVFAVPGAFTPTCSAQHLPGFIKHMDEIKAKGVEDVYCLSVNDKFVMRAWAENTEGCAESGVKLVADGNGAFTEAMGLVKDATGGRMGKRCMRFAAIVENGKVSKINVDQKGLDGSSAESMLSLL